ncbi:MAG TPA: hypothetical protein VE595_05960 [Nitrososphaeraceae archaeon]|nr:hypothetical protein [Nitrososphaeraceae archaeon]
MLIFNNSELCYLFLNNDLVTIIIPKSGNKDINKYGNTAKNIEGSKIPMVYSL